MKLLDLRSVFSVLAVLTFWCRANTTVLLLANEAQKPVSKASRAAEKKIAIGSSVESFELTDFRGKTWSSGEFSKAPGIVLVFLGTECPLAKFYSVQVNKLEQEFKDSGIVFLAVNSNVQDSLEMMAAFARKHEMEMPFLKDPAQQLANAVGATRTPEACVLNGQGKLVYRGRIDDQWGIGYTRDKPERTELKDAIEAVLAKQPVAVSEVAAQGCLIGRRRPSNSDGDVTYSNQISRIVQKHCLECHRDGEIGPMDFSNYEDVAAWSDMMLEVVRDKRMPPWHANPQFGHFQNDRSLSADEVDLLEKWVASGNPQGDPSQLPEPPKFTVGWQLPREPDLVVPVSDKPFKVKAKGVVEYQHFVHRLSITEDKWVKAAEVRAGNRAVVHHILVFDRPAGASGDIMPHRSFFAGFVPGGRFEPFPEGMAKRLPAGSELVFQVHYTPIGSEQLDQSQLGLVFVDDPSKLTHEVQTTSVVDFLFSIPPGEPNHPSSAELQRPLPDCELLSLTPHMHVRGKSFRYTATFPDGRKQVLLDVPGFDFNWQTDYQLSKRLPIPAGTQILGEATFDNSEANLNNPDPTKWVMFGDQTWDEMMIGYMHVAIPIDPATGQARSSVLPKDVREEMPSIKEIFTRLDRNQDGKITKDELPDRIQPFFILMDSNKDGAIAVDEFKPPMGRGRGRGRIGLDN